MMHGNVSVIPQNEVGISDFEMSCLKNIKRISMKFGTRINMPQESTTIASVIF